MRIFYIYFDELNKYHGVKDRKVIVRASDPQTATRVFMQNCGNLKKNKINYIQEVDNEGNLVGEKIVPDDVNDVNDEMSKSD